MDNIVTRAYNFWEVDNVRGTIKKISTNQKLLDERYYYEGIPSQFRIFFPRLVNANNTDAASWIEIERYDYPSLGDYLLGYTNDNLLQDHWHEIMRRLRIIFNLWREYPQNKKARMEDAYAMYISKTAREVEAFRNQASWPSDFALDELVINNASHSNFHVLWPSIQSYIQDVIIPTYEVSFIHGDCCLGNILYGASNGILRFIDPRGSFGARGCVGDIRYDVAKLAHSVDGGYEYLNHNKFSIAKHKDGNWSYALLLNYFQPYKEYALAAFNDIFFDSQFTPKFSRKEITLIQGLIFVGACARHYENADRQRAMYLIGIERLNAAMRMD